MPKRQHSWTYYKKYIHLYSLQFIYHYCLVFLTKIVVYSFIVPLVGYSNYWQAIVMDDIVTI